MRGLKQLRTVAFWGCVVVIASPQVSAIPTFTFGFDASNPLNQPISFGGNPGDALVAPALYFDTITAGGFGDARDGTVLNCKDDGCRLEFTTGPGVTLATGQLYSFAGGGSIQVTGQVEGPGNDPIPTTGPLLTGDWATATAFGDALDPNGDFSIIGSGQNTMDDALEAYFKLPGDTDWDHLNTQLFVDVTLASNGGFSGDIDTAILLNQDPNGVTFVPEPGTLALLGIGLVGLGAVSRRKKIAA